MEFILLNAVYRRLSVEGQLRALVRQRGIVPTDRYMAETRRIDELLDELRRL